LITRDRPARDREHGYVVFLAKLLGGPGDFRGGLSADRGGALKTEEFTVGIAGFKDAVCEQRKLMIGRELESGLGVGCV